MNLIDPDGMDWYKDKDNTYQYNPNLNKDNQAEILGKGQSYVGETYQVKDENGNVTTDYRKNGSIMFSNEKDGYNRMWNQANKVNREQAGVITDKGVLVLPDYKNEVNEAKIDEYNLGFTKKDLGKSSISVAGEKLAPISFIHTHQDKTFDPWPSGTVEGGGDYSFTKINMRGKVTFVIGWDNQVRSLQVSPSTGEWALYRVGSRAALLNRSYDWSLRRAAKSVPTIK